ncbi:MAG: LacI family DNA-binding transcriptional regulator [Flavobacteriaceae bacterium]|nr:LacI family DNA-binding transcriptional regulator [Flavobacteriaceae bacterium]
MGRDFNIKKLAALSDVSVSTVSKALSNSSEISDKTKRKVQKLAKLHNYKPSRLALNLKRGNWNTLGVVMPKFPNERHMGLLVQVEREAAENGRQVLVTFFDEKEVSLEQKIRTFSEDAAIQIVIVLHEVDFASQKELQSKFESELYPSEIIFASERNDSKFPGSHFRFSSIKASREEIAFLQSLVSIMGVSPT